MSEQDISAEVEELRQQRDQARAEFDSLGPVIERLEQAKSRICADNKHLFQRLREEEALTVKWQQRAEAAEAEAAELRERLADAERAAEVRLARIEVLRGALEAVGADAQALKPEVQQVHHDVLDLMRERDDLRERLTTVKALVPSAKLLQRFANIVEQVAFTLSPTANCERTLTQVQELRTLAARIRAWRGDGGEEEG